MTLKNKLLQLKAEKRKITPEIARDSGVPIGTLNKILDGESDNPTMRTLNNLATYFEVSLDYLMKEEETQRLAEEKRKQELDDMERVLIKKMRELPRYQKLKVIKLIEQL